jgi:hypothetical protein
LQEDFSWHLLSACEDALERFRYACFTHPEHSLKGQPSSPEIGTLPRFVQPTLFVLSIIRFYDDCCRCLRTTTPNSENDTERIALRSQCERGLAGLCPSHGMMSSVPFPLSAHAELSTVGVGALEEQDVA